MADISETPAPMRGKYRANWWWRTELRETAELLRSALSRIPAVQEPVAWVAFDQQKWAQQPLPAERRMVLVQVAERSLFARIGDGCGEIGTHGPTVAVGYLRFGGGDKNSPFFVVPGVGGPVVAWADCLGDSFTAEPSWKMKQPAHPAPEQRAQAEEAEKAKGEDDVLARMREALRFNVCESDGSPCEASFRDFGFTYRPLFAEAADLIERLQSDVARLQADEQKLQHALFRWLPNVRGNGSRADEQAAEDAHLLTGMEGDIPPDACWGETMYLAGVEAERERMSAERKAEELRGLLREASAKVAQYVATRQAHARSFGHDGARELDAAQADLVLLPSRIDAALGGKG